MNNREYAIVVGKAKNATPIINYVQATGRFTQTHDGNGRGAKEIEDERAEPRTQAGRGGE